jgi:hypothetical protein
VKKSGWIIFLLILSSAAYSQYQDARLWTSLSIRYDPGKKWKLSLEEEARFIDNVGRLEKLNTELTVDYQISKLLSAGILYRLISLRNSGGDFKFNNRFAGYLNIQKKFGGWTCSVKAAYQITYPEFFHSREWYLPERYIRPLAEISRELKNKNTEPYTNIEFWYGISPGKQAIIDQYRFTIGVKHKLSKTSRLDFFYRIQQELQVKNRLTAHIIGVGYRFMVR